MNCPHCGNRNPSTAKHCLHCGRPFPNAHDDEGLFDLDADDPDGSKRMNTVFYVIGGVFVVIIGGSMLLHGFDTYDGTCVHSASAAARYESAPEWKRDRSAEERARDRRDRRHRRQGGLHLTTHDGYLRCYQKKTGHVDGVMSK